MGKLMTIKCPRCAGDVKIPLYWAMGLESIIYCKDCKQYMKINYRLGALAAGIGWALALATIQFIGFFTSAITVLIAALAFIPLGVFYSFLIRRLLLKLSCKKKK